MVKKVAIIGSGMAGLAAAWYLGKDHEITLLERQSKIGIGAHSLDLDGGRVDVPLRVLYPGYYPELFTLLRQCGVRVEALDAALSFADWGGKSYFRYRNFHVGSKTIPLLSPSMLTRRLPRRILLDLARFMFRVPLDDAQGKLLGQTIGDYLHDQAYSQAFVEKFLVPCFAGINTVSNENVRRYPASLIAQYFTRGFVFSRVFRAVGGAQAISTALATRVKHTILGARIQSVRRSSDGVLIRFADGTDTEFAAVIFATQANQVLPVLSDATDEERAVLGGFRYDRVRVVMHSDRSLAPPDKRDWAPVNYLLSERSDRPMVTIWVNALLPSYISKTPMFQTINPLADVNKSLVLQQTDLERPTVDLNSEALIGRLDTLHCASGRRVFFCGSYAASGIPLLESATVSAKNLAALAGRW